MELSKIQSTLPMFIVEVCPPARNTILGFDHGSQIRMPKNQTCVELEKNQYLIFINNNGKSFGTLDSNFPLPLKINLLSVNNQPLEEEDKRSLFQQLFHYTSPAICYDKNNLVPDTNLKAEKAALDLSPSVVYYCNN